MYDNDDDLNQWKAENNARSGRSNDFSTGSAGWNAHNAEKTK
ncbi:hypothetical protein [Pedobacter sp. KBS0701]|nr:hypothetical protein [Pedobacter sp. KBS0701]